MRESIVEVISVETCLHQHNNETRPRMPVVSVKLIRAPQVLLVIEYNINGRGQYQILLSKWCATYLNIWSCTYSGLEVPTQ